MSPANPWLATEELCAQLAISHSTLFPIPRSGLLNLGRLHFRSSHLLWHQQRRSALLLGPLGRCGAMAESSPVLGIEPTGEYVLLHRDTGTALYPARVTEAEIPRANLNLRRPGNRSRYVSARHLGHGSPN